MRIGGIELIKRFFVKNLFGIYDNEINFREDGITIIIGQNGCGKTTMLHMLAALFSKNHGRLIKYQFDYIEVTLKNHILRMEMIDDCSDDEDISTKGLRYFIDSQVIQKCYRENSKINSPLFWVRAIPSLRRRPGNQFYDVRNGEVLNFSQVIDTYFDELPEEIKNDIMPIPKEVYA